MERSQPITQLLLRFWHHIGIRQRVQFGLLLILMVLASIAEILGIGAVLPFLAVLTSPERVFAHPIAQPLIEVLDIAAPEQLLIPLTVGFGLTVLIAGATRLLLLWASIRLSFAAGADLGISVYERTLYQPYAVHVSRNSSEIISGIYDKANSVIYSVVMPFVMLVSAGIMLCAILLALLWVNPLVALIAFGGFGFIYLTILRFTRHQQRIDSECMARESVQAIRSLQEGLGGIRDILIDGSQATYLKTYRNVDLRLRRAQGNTIFIGSGPRYGIEALGMLLIAALAYALAQQPDGIGQAIPVLGTLALGAQRLLPVLHQAYGSWVSIQSGHWSLQDTLELLDQPMPNYAGRPTPRPMPFRQSIKLRQISFQYTSQGPWVLNDLNLTIERGSRVGFIGITGSGKSTLVDIVMGLLQPTTGTLEIDGQEVTPSNNRSWQAHIAHVPQSIFLADSTIEENIAFGIPKNQIDVHRVRQAADQAQIANLIETWPERYQTLVGERGVRLSGGQRQRIGIARALYRQADVIILDEATSALDNITEHAVMQAIDALSKDITLLIIAHRVSTLGRCTHIVEIGNCGIKRTGSYKEIASQEP